MDYYTVLWIPDHHGRVKRFRISARLVRRGALAIGIGVVATGFLAFDWARARIDTRELSRLRVETTEQRTHLQSLQGAVQGLESRLSRVMELERKVRIIADLPAPAEKTVSPPGVGGEDDEQDLPQASPIPSEPAAETAPVGAEPQASAPQASPRASHVAGLHARAEELARLAESREESLGRLVEQLQGKSQRLAATPSIWPTQGWVTSGYGWRTSPFTGRRHFHAGIDVAGKPGTSVVAPAAGKVAFAGDKGSLGKTVILDHGYGVRTVFGHNASVAVRQGQEVVRGQKVAALGSTGRSTGPHLHYAVQLDGRRVDPRNYILEE